MKEIIWLKIAVIACLMSIGCTESRTDTSKEFKETLKSSVYGLSDTVDASCMGIPTGTDYYPRYVFVDDTMFIGTIHNCCMPTVITYFSGTYKVKEDRLLLTYDSTYIQYTSSIETDTTLKMQATPEEIKEERTEIIKEEWTRIACGKHAYFIMQQEPWPDGKMAYSSTQVNDILENMKKVGVWKQMKRLRSIK